jgi:hypothetical protein
MNGGDAFIGADWGGAGGLVLEEEQPVCCDVVAYEPKADGFGWVGEQPPPGSDHGGSDDEP